MRIHVTAACPGCRAVLAPRSILDNAGDLAALVAHVPPEVPLLGR